MTNVCARLTRFAGLALFAWSMLLTACSGDKSANIELRIVSDLVPFYEVGVATAVLHDGQANESDVSLGSVERALTVGEPLARGLWIATFSGIPHGTYTVWTTLRRENGEVLGRKPITFTLSGDASFSVTIEAACAAVECPNGGNSSFLACVAGECVDPRCTPETPEHCPVGPSPFCDVDTTCEATLPCGVARCESGVCLQIPEASECDEGEYCSALSGCTLEERPVDAPEDEPGLCGNACSLADRPCHYAYIVCTEGEQPECEAVSVRPEGAPCPNGGVCSVNGECIEGVREDGGVTLDAGLVADAEASDMDVTEDASIAIDMETPLDMDVAVDMTVAIDMGMTSCPNGYVGTVETGCLDINECTYNVCDALTECTNAPGSFSCSACPSGFAGTGETGCRRENGCDEVPCDALTVCNPTGVGTFACSACPVGYLGTGERGCFDINECTYNVCDALTTCANTSGGFTCTACPSGYMGAGETGCDDIDECAFDACDPLATCTNLPGSFSCGACPGGYTGDGAAGCDDVDECEVNNGDCGNPRYEGCINTPGSNECAPLSGPVRLTQGSPIFSVTFPANDASVYPALSEDGTYVAFESSASNLVASDSNGFRDVFVRNETTGTTVRASTSATGVEGNGDSTRPRLTADGTAIVFLSAASNLVAGDTNGVVDVFLKDLTTGAISRVSTDGSGAQANGASEDPSISADGARVVFSSTASNLVASDTNAVRDVFVKQISTGAVTRVSTDALGAESNGVSRLSAISADGTAVVFLSSGTNLVASDANGRDDIFVKTLATGAIVRASTSASGVEANVGSGQAFLSGDGSVVVFASYATNLVAGDTNGRQDAFVKILATGAITRVSVSTAGVQSNHDTNWVHIDDDATRVVFGSTATNLVADDTNGAQDIFLRELSANTTVRVSTNASGAQAAGEAGTPAISADGSHVAFYSYASTLVPNDSNGTADAFVKSIASGAVSYASAAIGESGLQANGASEYPRASADGKKIVFVSSASNLVAGDTNGLQDVFVMDLVTNAITRVSVAADGAQADALSGDAQISANGLFVVFTSSATNLIAGDTNGVQDVFVKTLATGEISRVSTSAAGVEGNGLSASGHLSANGQRLVFVSHASNLVAGDTNGVRDVFVRDLSAGTVALVSTSASGVQANAVCDSPSLSADGSLVAFSTGASNLVPSDTNTAVDVFVKTLATGAIARVSVSASGVEATWGANSPVISADGSAVVFLSSSTNLAAPCSVSQINVFVKTLATNAIACVSVDSSGALGNGGSSEPSISADGMRVAFASSASNLSAGDGNATDDIFVRDRVANTTVIVSVTEAGVVSNRRSRHAFIFADGTRSAFTSLGSNLVVDDTNAANDIFIVGLGD